MATIHLIKLMFCLKLLLILLCVFIIFKLVMLLIQWKKHKVLMLPKLIFVIICLIIGLKGYNVVHSIQSDAQSHEAKIVKARNASKRLYERKGSEAVAKKMSNHAKVSGTHLWQKSKSKYHSIKNKMIDHSSNKIQTKHHESQAQLHHQYQQNEKRIKQQENK